MSWSDSRAQNDAGGGGGLFLKLPGTGDSATVVFRGEPLTERSYWDKQLDHSVLLLDGEEAPASSEGEKITHKCNVYVVDEKATRIFQLNAPTFEQVDDIMKALGEEPFFNQKLLITRKGTGKKTKYSVIQTGSLTADEHADMRQQPEHELVVGGSR